MGKDKVLPGQGIISNAQSAELLEEESLAEYPSGEQEPSEQVPPRMVYQATNPHYLWGKCFWGLDIGSKSIKIVGLHKGMKRVSLVHLAVIEIAPGQRLGRQGVNEEARAAAISKALRALEMEHSRMATSLDRASVVIRQIQYPAAARDKLLSALQWEVRKYIPFRPDEVVVDAQIMEQASQQDGKLEVLLVAATKEHLQQHLGLLERVGVKPTMVDADPLALINAFLAQRDPESEETVVILDLGATATTLNILSHSGYYFTLSLSVGGERFTAEIQAQCQLEYALAEDLKQGGKLRDYALDSGKLEAPFHRALEKNYDLLVKEIRQALVYYNKQSGVNRFDHMILTGGGAGLPGLSQYLAKKTGIAAEVLNPLQEIKIEQKYFNLEKISALAPQLAIAVGLAKRWKV